MADEKKMAKKPSKKPPVYVPMNKYVYDFLLWTFSVLVDLFFREVHPRGSWKIPRKGPVIFVAAPHANQFVDPLILMRAVRMEAKRRIVFLIAEKSMSRPFIGWFARHVGAVSVGRAMDAVHPAEGKIYLPDPENDPTLVRGVGTKFDHGDFQVGGLLVLPSVNNTAANAEIVEINGPEEIRIKKPFKGQVAVKQITGREDVSEEGKLMNGVDEGHKGPAPGFEGTTFKVAPKVDQSQVYDAVFEALNKNSCIGIFPEGGSHDRTELLPLKAGVAIMALGAIAQNPDCNVKIVPVGMNYFHAHKFRSRAVIEFGNPIEVPQDLIELYKKGERRDAIGTFLQTIYNALVAVTVTSPDYDTLMLIQAVRRLYNPKGKHLPLPMVVELNRRLVKGYTRYKDDPRIMGLKKRVIDYNKRLRQLALRDHQVQYAKFSSIRVIALLFYRTIKLTLLSLGVLPGLILFAPVFIIGKVISRRKAKEALAASTVKIQARDVMATWKLLVAMALAPTLYTLYNIFLASWTYYNRVQGYVPEWVHLWAVFVGGYIFFPTITYAALRFGEVGMDIFKSLRPLVLSLNPSSSNTLVKLQKEREDLVTEITDVINELGPEMFPDFDHARIVADPTQYTNEGDRTPASPRGRSHNRRESETYSLPDSDSASTGEPGASIGGASSVSGNLPRNDSFKNLGNFGFFASRPTTPNKSRSRTSSQSGFGGAFGGLSGFSKVDERGGAEELSKKIRGAMRERGQRRKSEVEGEEEYLEQEDAKMEEKKDI